MTAGVEAWQLALLVLCGLAGGVGITALGPGGVVPTLGLFTLTGLAPAEVAGTAMAVHLATGALAAAAFTRSGQLRGPETRRTALLLGGAALLGTPLGVQLNSAVSARGFGLLLATLAVAVAALVWWREHRPPAGDLAHPPVPQVLGLGLAVAVASGTAGIGGPMLTVPLLIALGVPVLESLAAAQVQSVVIAGLGVLGYLGQGAVHGPLAAAVGVPALVGVLVGWRVAHALPTRRLKHALIVALLAVAPYLAISG